MKKQLAFLSVAVMIALSGCGNNNNAKKMFEDAEQFNRLHIEFLQTGK